MGRKALMQTLSCVREFISRQTQQRKFYLETLESLQRSDRRVRQLDVVQRYTGAVFVVFSAGEAVADLLPEWSHRWLFSVSLSQSWCLLSAQRFPVYVTAWAGPRRQREFECAPPNYEWSWISMTPFNIRSLSSTHLQIICRCIIDYYYFLKWRQSGL